MTAEKVNLDIFDAELLSEMKYREITFRCFSNRIVYIHIPKYEKISIDVIEVGYGFIEQMGGGRYYNIYHFESFSDVDPEIREWAANEDGNLNTYTDAIVIGSLSQKIITDFYLKFNKPVKPTKIFFTLDKAISWSRKQFDKHQD